MNDVIRILGIDPGLRKTGWGVIEARGNTLSFVGAGTVKAATEGDLAKRLLDIAVSLETLLDEFKPQEAAVEETFVNKDARATLKLGQARGICLYAPARFGIRVFEYAPNQVKKTVTGVGHGDKKQVRTMVGMLLPKARFDSDDAADALAIAICHAHHRKADNRLNAALRGAVA
ncbi:MAG: crossover junction endodeoxyribonuclease RuvC [Pseudomonadota bacterium]